MWKRLLASQVADGLLIASDNQGDVQEGLSTALRLDEFNAAAGHSAVGVDATQGLNECGSALPALESLSIGQDAHRTAPDGAVADVDRLGAVLVQVADVAALGARLGRHGVFGFNQVVIAINMLGDDVPAFEVKDVGHVSKSGCRQEGRQTSQEPTRHQTNRQWLFSLGAFFLLYWRDARRRTANGNADTRREGCCGRSSLEHGRGAQW